MDNEMIKRISKVIIETPNASDYEYLVVRNVVRAMREPTDKMNEAANDVGPDRSPIEYWEAYIDSITNE